MNHQQDQELYLAAYCIVASGETITDPVDVCGRFGRYIAPPNRKAACVSLGALDAKTHTLAADPVGLGPRSACELSRALDTICAMEPAPAALDKNAITEQAYETMGRGLTNAIANAARKAQREAAAHPDDGRRLYCEGQHHGLATALRMIAEWVGERIDPGGIFQSMLDDVGPADMAAADGPRCGCGAPSVVECGLCGACAALALGRRQEDARARAAQPVTTTLIQEVVNEARALSTGSASWIERASGELQGFRYFCPDGRPGPGRAELLRATALLLRGLDALADLREGHDLDGNPNGRFA